MRTILLDDTVSHAGLSIRVRAVRGPKWHYVVVTSKGLRAWGKFVRRCRHWAFGASLRRAAVRWFLAETVSV